MRLLNWNLEFAPVGSAKAAAIAGVIEQYDPDVVCLTETHASWPMVGGHWIWADPGYGYPGNGDRRKVGLWSRSAWTDVDVVGDPDLPGGRFVAGTTESDVGPVRVIGVCIPWRMAHVATGRRDRSAWEDHRAYLAALRSVIGRATAEPGPIVVTGDYNQRVPRMYTPVSVHEALLDAFEPLTIVTAGDVPGLAAPVIDHVAVGGLTAGEVTGIPRTVDGRRVSDHDGVLVALRPT